jgi:hypothetical protein
MLEEVQRNRDDSDFWALPVLPNDSRAILARRLLQRLIRR